MRKLCEGHDRRRRLGIKEDYREEHSDGEVGQYGAWHKRNRGQVGRHVWPGTRRTRPVRL